MKNHIPNIIGGVLVIAYFIQAFVPALQWNTLVELQGEQSFKRWTGVILGSYMAFQWTLSYIRTKQKYSDIAEKYAHTHMWVGGFSPLLLYIHTVEFGYLYTSWFAYVFLANILLGLFNTDSIKASPYWYYLAWMIVHVAFSLCLTLLLFYHIFVVFYYK